MSKQKHSADEVREIEQFLYQEASYLDKAELDNWFELYTEDGTYWMPVIPDQQDPLNHVSLFYDDRVMMEVRRRNLKHPRAASKDLPIRCSHIISNVQLQENNEEGVDAVVTSNFQCVIFSFNKQTLYAGTYTHHLVRNDGALAIRHKRVDLINCDAVLGSIIIYI